MHTSLRFTGVALSVGLAMAGCRRFSEPVGETPAHGRYAGIGIYAPGASWQRMVAAQPAKDSPAAKTVDDQAIVVVVDSVTGEVRGCGDMSGYCTGMNPWRSPLVSSQLAPVSLTSHAKSIDEEAEASATSDSPAASR